MAKIANQEAKIKFRADRDLAFIYVGRKKVYLGRPGTIEFDREKEKAFKLLAALATTDNRQTRKTPVRRGSHLTAKSAVERLSMRPYANSYPIDSLFTDYLRSRKAVRMNTADKSRIINIQRWLNEWFPTADGDNFDQFDLETFRQRMEGLTYISGGKRKKYCRLSINKTVSALKKVLKWGVLENKFNSENFHKIALVPQLQMGETTAPESERKVLVNDSDVAATLPYMSEKYADIIRIQRITGMRTGEICELSNDTIDEITYRAQGVAIFRPRHHKNAHRGHQRQIPLTRDALEILSKYRGNEPYLFMTEDGNKMTTQRIDRKVRNAVQRAIKDGVIARPWTPYDLRTKRITDELLKGNVKRAQHIAGHRTLNTQQYYDLTGLGTAIEAAVESELPEVMKG